MSASADEAGACGVAAVFAVVGRGEHGSDPGGDSGAGVYGADGRLAGIVFAVPTERDDATYAVGAAELRAVLTSTDHSEHRCDPSRSRLVPAG